MGSSSVAVDFFFIVPLFVAAFSKAATMLGVGPGVGLTVRRAGMGTEGAGTGLGLRVGWTVASFGGAADVEEMAVNGSGSADAGLCIDSCTPALAFFGRPGFRFTTAGMGTASRTGLGMLVFGFKARFFLLAVFTVFRTTRSSSAVVFMEDLVAGMLRRRVEAEIQKNYLAKLV